MKSNKIIQKKFRIDARTDEILKRILIANHVSLQFVLESMLKDYIYKNLNAVLDKNN